LVFDKYLNLIIFGDFQNIYRPKTRNFQNCLAGSPFGLVFRTRKTNIEGQNEVEWTKRTTPVCCESGEFESVDGGKCEKPSIFFKKREYFGVVILWIIRLCERKNSFRIQAKKFQFEFVYFDIFYSILVFKFIVFWQNLRKRYSPQQKNP